MVASLDGARPGILAGAPFPGGTARPAERGADSPHQRWELGHLLTHPRYEHAKEYHVYVAGYPSDETLRQWRRGVFLDGQWTAPADAHSCAARRTIPGCGWCCARSQAPDQAGGAMLGHPVHRLIRVRIGPLRLGNLKPGQWRRLTDAEIKSLRSVAQKSKGSKRTWDNHPPSPSTARRLRARARSAACWPSGWATSISTPG